MTAHALAGDRDRCLAWGMDDYLSKPLREGALRTVLDKWAPAVAGAAPELVDMGRLRRVCRSDADVSRLVGIFVGETSGHLQELASAIASGQADAARRAAHTMAGASGNLGFVHLEKGMRELESELRRGMPGDAASRLEELKKRFADTRADLDARLSGKG